MKYKTTRIFIVLLLPVIGGLVAMIFHRTALGIFIGILLAGAVYFITSNPKLKK